MENRVRNVRCPRHHGYEVRHADQHQWSSPFATDRIAQKKKSAARAEQELWQSNQRLKFEHIQPCEIRVIIDKARTVRLKSHVAECESETCRPACQCNNQPGLLLLFGEPNHQNREKQIEERLVRQTPRG